MGFFAPQFKPGVNKEETSLKNEGGWSDSNLVRDRNGLPEPVGGWQLFTVSQFAGKARGAHAWRTLEGKQVFAFGTTDNLYASLGGGLRNITGPMHETTLNNVFTTENGSSIVVVHLDFHRVRAGQTVTFSNHQSTIAGLTIEGDYVVDAVLTNGRFTIDAGSNANATEEDPTGGYVDFLAYLPAGLDDTPITGYGTGTYGSGSYSVSGETSESARVWSLDNWGEFLLANPSGFGIWEWQPELNYVELAFNGNFDDDAAGWGLGTGWAYDGTNKRVNKTGTTASNLSQDVRGVLEGGRTYRIRFNVTRTAGTLKLRMNAGTDTPAVIDMAEASSPISKSGTYDRTFLCPADALDIVFEADSSFAGSVDSVSYHLEALAYRIKTAPPRVDAMFVDPRGLAVALGTTLTNGFYSPTAARCSDLGNNREWVPDTESLASEYTLRGGGGRLMGGLATAEQDLVWGDDGVFSFQYKGEFGDAFNIRLLGTKCGLLSRHSMGEQNGFVVWAANTNQFFIFRGVGVQNLGKPEILPCTLQKDVFDNLDTVQSLKCHIGINPEFTEAWFFYPDRRDVANSIEKGECSRAVSVNWTEGTWRPHRILRTAWIASGVFETPIGFHPQGKVFRHETGVTANGAKLDAWTETSYFDVKEGDKLFALMEIIPDIAHQVGNVKFEFWGKLYPQDPEEYYYGEFTSTPQTPYLNPECMARQMKMRISSASQECFWHLGALRLDVIETRAKL